MDVQIEVLKGWGFTFVTSGHWSKKTKNWKQHFGTGYCLRGAGEPFLIGKIGKPTFANNVRSVFEARTRENSRKPDLAYGHAIRLAPEARTRLDLFSRQQRAGWDAAGYEFDKFNGGKS